MSHKYKIGDKVVVNLRQHRGTWYSEGIDSTTLEGEPDGTAIIIADVHQSGYWYRGEERAQWYPESLLLQNKTTRQKLHEAVRSIR